MILNGAYSQRYDNGQRWDGKDTQTLRISASINQRSFDWTHHPGAFVQAFVLAVSAALLAALYPPGELPPPGTWQAM